MCFVEIIFGISLLLYNGKYTKWGYCFHLFGLFLNLTSFLLVIRLWNHVLASQRLLPVYNTQYIVFLLINFISLIFDIVIYCIYGENEMNLFGNIVVTITNSIYILSLFITSCVLLWYGNDLKKKLTATTRIRTTTRTKSTTRSGYKNPLKSLLIRINISLLMFIICYGIRIIGLTIVTIVSLKNGHSVNLDPVRFILWIIFFFWIPTICPGVIFLYVMRYHPSHQNENSEENLLDSTSSAISVTSERDVNHVVTNLSTDIEGNDQEVYRNRMQFYSTDSNDNMRLF